MSNEVVDFIRMVICRDSYVTVIQNFRTFYLNTGNNIMMRCSMNFSRAVTPCVAVIAVMSFLGVTSPVSASGFTDYDIALQELNKVKKVQPKKEIKKRRKQRTVKKTASTGKSAKPVVIEIPSPLKSESGAAVLSNGTPVVESMQPAVDKVDISHEPFSYVVTGKRILLQAVVDSTENMEGIFCRFRSTTSEAWARVPMTQVEDTHFTYKAILPALASGARAILYTFVVVDLQGKEVIGREYTMPVKSSLIVPGWQQPPSAENLGVILENSATPLDGFKDPGFLPSAP